MDSLRKSVKSDGSHKHSLSLPELNNQDHNADCHEVVVKIDGYGQNEETGKIWRAGSYDFHFSQQTAFNPSWFAEDPSSRLIMRKNQATGATMCPATDLEMNDLKREDSPLPRVNPIESPDSSSSESSDDEKEKDRDVAEVVSCTSNSSFKRTSAQLRNKTKSRLMDYQSPPPPSPDRRSGRPPLHPTPGQYKSGSPRPKYGPADEDDDDPFMDSDIPDELKQTKMSISTILQWLGLILIIGALICSLVFPVLRRRTIWSLRLWKWEVLILVLMCGRLVSGWFVRMAVFLIERSLLLRKRVLYFVYGVRCAVQNCLWLGLVLISWRYLFDKRTSLSPVLPYISKILLCLLVATILRLVKTLLIKVLASSFHVSIYFDRIQETLFNQYIIETLSGLPLHEETQTMAEVNKLQKAGAKMPIDLQEKIPHHNINQKNKNIKLSRAMSVHKREDGGIMLDQLHKLNQKNISAWNMKRLMRIVRYRALATLDEKILGEDGDFEDCNESSMHILSEHEAQLAARKIFRNVAKPGSKYIYFADLKRFMREEEALKAMNLFDRCKEHKRVGKKSLKNWVVNAFRERKALALTLNDTKTAVNKLRQMANAVVGIITFALSLLILEIATTHFFVFLSSQLLLAVFVFGETVKTVFECIVFLFVIHPYDVGDRCEVDDVQLVVEEMHIMTTIFLRYDNLKILYPNNVLATKPISNYYRSPDMGDSIDFTIHVATPPDKIAKMKEKITQFMENKKEHWYPGSQVVLRDVEDSNKLKVSIWMRQRINFQDMGMRFERRELVMQEMIRVLREHDIEYRMHPLDVNVYGEHWYPGSLVVLRDVEDSNKLKVSIWMRQRINFQDMGMGFERRELVVQEMIRVLREHDIEYRMHPLDVNVRNLPAVNSTRLPSTWSSVG